MHAEPEGTQVVYETTDETDLQLARIFLISHGVACEVYEVKAPRTRVFTTSKIYVETSDVPLAREVLAEYSKTNAGTPRSSKINAVVVGILFALFLLSIAALIVTQRP